MDLDRFVPERSRSAASRVMSWSVEGIKEIRNGVSCWPTTEGPTAVCGRNAPVDFDAWRPGIVLPRCAARWPEGWEVLSRVTTCDAPGAGTGGSAMPCGL